MQIQKYLDFKIGEVWVEISDELSYEGVRPVSPDQECIAVAFEMTNKKATDIQERQEQMARKKEDVLDMHGIVRALILSCRGITMTSSSSTKCFSRVRRAIA